MKIFKKEKDLKYLILFFLALLNCTSSLHAVDERILAEIGLKQIKSIKLNNNEYFPESIEDARILLLTSNILVVDRLKIRNISTHISIDQIQEIKCTPDCFNSNYRPDKENDFKAPDHIRIDQHLNLGIFKYYGGSSGGG